LGFDGVPEVRLARIKIAPRRVSISETVEFHFDLVSMAPRAQSLLVDYRVFL
jgi:hypothetical protein